MKKKTASGFSYTPVFEIVDWVERPDDMPKPRASDQRRPTKAAPFGRTRSRSDYVLRLAAPRTGGAALS